MKNFIKSSIVVATLLAPLGTMSLQASATSYPTLLPTCGSGGVEKPINYGLSCKNVGIFLSRISWTSWTTKSAAGSGKLVNNGKSTFVSFTVSGIKTVNGRKYFTTISGPGLSKVTLP